ncbi:hypothetical protein O1611_g5563 [Lasiodiplodia mahajangana]|uniref:Uncharacterized protein n=1 Tax=Lasiodiplodia mahajangana TaxID=1108764 RepID=A0ACC2JKN6_9PEZI|nr:hypothetical protein O1611_g5563 [Lasiodiplodia mahajangana]
MEETPDSKFYVEPSEARTFVENVLIGNGVPASNAEIVARCLVAADLRGVDTHGINRIPSYMTRVRQGVLDGTASPELTKITPVVAQVDARNGFGFLAASKGMAAAVNMAREFGIGMFASSIEAKTEAQAAHLKYLAGLMTKERDLFRKVYRYAFVAGKEGDQRALSLELALLYWDTLFKKPGQSWIGSSRKTDWLNEWKCFLQENWKRSVNRDMWNQTLEFAFKSIDDDSLGFWSEDGAWPGVIDDFVAWYKRKSSEMEVDA